MCWNWKVSITTWFIGLITSIYLLKRRNKYDITLALLILSYSSIQLWEAFMWWGQDCGILNKIGNTGAYFGLWSHILALGIGLYIEFGITIPLYIGVSLGIVAIIQYFNITINCSKPKNGGCTHLSWGFNSTYYIYVFAVCIGICLAVFRPLWKSVVISSLFILSLAFSFWYGKSQDATASMWCWIAAAFSPIFIYINSY